MRFPVVLDQSCAAGGTQPPKDPGELWSARLRRLAPVVVHPAGPRSTAARLTVLADVLDAATAPVLVLDDRYTGHDSPLVDVIADPRPASTVLAGVTGEAWPARVVEGVVASAGSPLHDVDGTTDATPRTGGLVRIAVVDLPVAAAAVRDLALLARAQGWSSAPLVPLVTVALARSGVRLHPVRSRGYVAVVARTIAERKRALAASAAQDEHRTRLANAAREADGFYSTFVVRRLSRPATALALRLGLTPNQVTLASLAIAAVAAACFAAGTRSWLVAGAVLLQVSLVVDCVDGELARYTRQQSALGAWLDAGTDRVKEFGVYAALAVGAARGGSSVWLLAGAVLALQMTRHFVDFGFAVRQGRRTLLATTPLRVPLEQRSDAALDASGAVGSVSRSAQWGRSATELSERTNRVGPLVWAKRAVIMPIGERWLVLSVASALSGPRLALLLLLVLGAVAAAYTTAGRVLRSAAEAVPLGERAGDLVVMADVGPLPRALLARWSARRLGWLLPAASRAVEGAGVIAVVALAAPDRLALAYGYLFVLSLWHYDVVYRLRHIGEGPRPAVQEAGLGAPVRLLVLVVAGVVGGAATTAVLTGLSVLVLALVLVDSSRAWRSWFREQAASVPVPRFTVEGLS